MADVVSICPVCEDEFEQPRRAGHAHTYCSRACAVLAREATTDGMTEQAIANELGVSRTRVQQIIASGLRKMRAGLEGRTE